jgi:glycosyltransferase involved in cell wall biosynthesis
MMKIEDIARIKAPIVWSLHDMWAFTGGCHYDEECGGYKESCGECKVLGSNKTNDLSRKVFQRKQKAFTQKKDITIVGLSHWLNECSKNSTLLKEKKHINLPNPIDTNLFKPFEKEKARELWSLPKDKKLVLFGVMGATSNLRKGFKELSEALHKLTCKDVEFVVFGSSEPQVSQNFGFKTHYLGHLHDDVSLVTLYSAVDVMIVPSIQEAFGQTASEAMACGTPVVAFGATGLLDIVDHKINGYLAKPFDTDDLANGIEWVLHVSDYEQLCKNAREKVLKEFEAKVVAKKYIELYKDIFQSNYSLSSHPIS